MLALMPRQMAQTRDHAAKNAVDLGRRRPVFVAALRS
jgi:hypothetical protein